MWRLASGEGRSVQGRVVRAAFSDQLVSTILSKLGVTDRTQAAVLAIRAGLLGGNAT